jgi:hypothetical protein
MKSSNEDKKTPKVDNKNNKLDLFSNRIVGSPEWWQNIRLNPSEKFRLFKVIEKSGVKTPRPSFDETQIKLARGYDNFEEKSCKS